MDLVYHNFDDKRGNKTRKVEGKQNLDPDKAIYDYLSSEGDKRLNEILIHLNKSGLLYSKQGLIKKLNILSGKSRKLLRKISVKGSYPIYRAVDKTKFQIQSDSYAFKDYVCYRILELTDVVDDKELKQIKPYPNNQQKKIISKLIFEYGLISLYTLLASYRRSISPKRDNKQNKTMHELWLKNALSFEINLKSAKFSNILNMEFDKLRISNGKKVNELLDQDRINEVKNLEDVFSKMFPYFKKEFDACEKIIDDDKDNNDKNNKLIRDIYFEKPEMLLS